MLPEIRSSRLRIVLSSGAATVRLWASRFPRLGVAIPALSAALIASACVADGPTAPTDPEPPALPPAEAPETPLPTPTFGALVVDIADAPPNTAPTVRVRAGTMERVVRQSRTVDSLPPGDYTILADELLVDDVAWVAEPDTQRVSVRANQAAPRVFVRFVPRASAVTITESGLPSYARGTVRVTGPGGFSITALTRDTLRLRRAGEYTLAAEPVQTTDGRFEATPNTRTITVFGLESRTVSFDYAPVTASIAVSVDGLPDGVPAGVQLTGPGGFAASVDSSETLRGLNAGIYRATATRVRGAGFSFDPDPATAEVSITGIQQRSMAFGYTLATGAIGVLVQGLPSGTAGAITVTGPGGFSRTVSATTTLTDLAPGSYQVLAAPVTAGGVSYTPQPASQPLTVTASMIAVPAVVQYAGAVGALDLEVSGLPPSINASIQLTRAGQAPISVTGSTVLSSLPPGQYTIAAQPVSGPSSQWTPLPASQSVTIVAGGTASATVAYVATAGALHISVLGLPAGADANVRVTGPGSTDVTVTGSTTLADLDPGTYTVAALTVTVGGTVYTPAVPSSTIQVTSGETANKTVTYGGTSTALTVDFNGLPGGATPAATVTGPNGFTATLDAPSVLENLAAGTYVITAAPVSASGATYLPSPVSQSVSLSAGQREERTVTYALSTGSIALSISGLPGSVSAAVVVTGPGGFSRTVGATETLTNLTPGTYTVSASPVMASGASYVPTPASRTVVVSASLIARSAVVSYAVSTGSIRATLNGLPGSADGAAALHGPSGTAVVPISQSVIVTGLATGAWELRGADVTISAETYRASPAVSAVTVAANDTADALLSFSRITGRLTVTVNGLPGGVNAAVTVTGPGGYSVQLTGGATLVGLAAGTYTITSAAVNNGATAYSPTNSVITVSVPEGANRSRTVSYTGQSTALTISVTGLPPGADADLTVTGPGGYSESVSGSTVLTGLAAGSYTLTAAPVTAGLYSYAATPASQSVSLQTGESESAGVQYSASSGALTVNVNGLPAGVDAPVTVTGPGGFSQQVTSSQTLPDLAPGSYTISAASATSGATTFLPDSPSQSVSVSAGATAVRSLSYTGNSTTLTVQIGGLPAGVNAAVVVTGPNGYSATLTGTTTLTDLDGGSYTITSSSVTHDFTTYNPSPAVISLSFGANQQRTRTVNYAPSTAQLAVTISGVPTATTAAVTVTGPSGFSEQLTATQTLSGLVPGSYTVSAADIAANGYSYAGTPATAVLDITAGQAAQHAVAYAASTGRLTVSVSGLPGGTSAPITVTGPGGFSQAVTSTSTLSSLVPGSYTITAGTVTSGATLYSPSSASQSVVVSAGSTASRSVSFSSSAASLQVTISGTPGTTPADVLVTGPGGFSQVLTATTTLTGVALGTYTIAANPISNGNYSYGGTPATQTRSVAAGQAQTASVSYAATTGRVTVSVTGLPGGVNGSLQLTGPAGYSQNLTGSATLTDLLPGAYTLTASEVSNGGTLYTPTPTSVPLSVAAGVTRSASVAYTGSQTSLAIAINGVPGGASANVNVSGPGGYSQSLTGSTTLSGLAAGSYTISAAPFTHGGYSYGGTPASQVRTVTAGQQQSGTVTYAATTGRLSVTVSGLPGGASAAVTVTGPGGFSQAITSSTTLGSLTPGSYTITSSNVSSGGSTYAPNTPSITATVSAGSTASRTVTYAVSGGGGGGGSDPDLIVEGAYITQAIQNFNGTVPLVANRDALVRVFVRAATANSLQPDVRVRLYMGSTNYRTITIPAPSGSVPTAIAEGTLNSSWNATIPAADVREGMRIRVDVDPNNTVNEPDETDNVWPRTGTEALDVRTVAPFDVVFIPVHQSANGLTGRVDNTNMESTFLSMTRRIFPLAEINASVRATYTTNVGALQSNDGNFAWLSLLSEINSLRVAEGSSAHYYGVVNTSYGSGIAGYAYVPGRAGIGWDKPGSAPRVTAHELGHNFSRRHVAACGSGNTDSNYPYANGQITLFGWNSTSNTIVSPTHTDIMGYCSTQWISDYTWTNVMNYRGPAPMMAGFASAAQRTLMVFGSVRNGVVTLEPAMRMVTRPALPERAGRYRLELRDKNGSVLTGVTFEPHAVDHNDDAQAFAFAIPMSSQVEARLVSVAVVGGANGPVVQSARVSQAAIVGDSASAPAMITADDGISTVSDPQPVPSRAGSATTLDWDATTWPLAMVRDDASGRVLGYLRRRGDQFRAAGAVRITFSNGVQSVTRTLVAP